MKLTYSYQSASNGETVTIEAKTAKKLLEARRLLLKELNPSMVK